MVIYKKRKLFIFKSLSFFFYKQTFFILNSLKTEPYIIMGDQFLYSFIIERSHLWWSPRLTWCYWHWTADQKETAWYAGTDVSYLVLNASYTTDGPFVPIQTTVWNFEFDLACRPRILMKQHNSMTLYALLFDPHHILQFLLGLLIEGSF